MTFYDISVTMNNPKYWNSVICFFVNVYKMSKLTKLKEAIITFKCCIYCVQTIYMYTYIYYIIDNTIVQALSLLQPSHVWRGLLQIRSTQAGKARSHGRPECGVSNWDTFRNVSMRLPRMLSLILKIWRLQRLFTAVLQY